MSIVESHWNDFSDFFNQFYFILGLWDSLSFVPGYPGIVPGYPGSVGHKLPPVYWPQVKSNNG